MTMILKSVTTGQDLHPEELGHTWQEFVNTRLERLDKKSLSSELLKEDNNLNALLEMENQVIVLKLPEWRRKALASIIFKIGLRLVEKNKAGQLQADEEK